MKLYDYYSPGDRTYNSVYTPTVKVVLLDIVESFNAFLHTFKYNPFHHKYMTRREARQNLYSWHDYDCVNTYDESEVQVKIYVLDSCVEYESVIACRLITKYRNGKTKSYHVRVPKVAGDLPRYKRKLKLKIGMVGY